MVVSQINLLKHLPGVIIRNFESNSRGRTNSNGSLNASTGATPPLMFVLSLRQELHPAVAGCRDHLVVGVHGGG